MRLARWEIGLLRQSAGLLALASVLGSLTIVSSVGLMAVSAYLISRAAVAESVADIALAITGVRVLAISRAAFRYFERYLSHRAAFDVLATLRTQTFRTVEPLAPAGLDDRHSGDLLARIVHDVDTLEDLPLRIVVPPIVAVVAGAIACIAVAAIAVPLGVTLLGFLVLGGVGLPMLMRGLARRPARESVAERAALDVQLVDFIQGLPDLVAADLAENAAAELLARGERRDRLAIRLAMVRGLGSGLSTLIAGLAVVVLLALAVAMVTSGALPGVLLAVVPLAGLAAFEAVQPLVATGLALDATGAAAARLFELTQQRSPVPDPLAPQPLPSTAGIRIRDLGFAYPDSAPVLEHLNLDVPAGRSLSIAGASGSGKSTLVSLLLRLREPTTGSIELGGADTRELRATDVRRAFSVVPQQVYLFSGTVRDNLAVADAEASDAELEAACRTAQVHDEIAALPQGYATVIGENGALLSGGERQRLAIARALLKDAPVIVFDEATSSLDEATETRLLDALALALAGRTQIWISHRRSVLARTDVHVELASPL
jgi:thiol reductant ABC exporter CydC subunit